jgi:putative Mn2+ efflux pump MntP
MNNFEIVILAVALVFNSWISYLSAGTVLSKEPFKRKAIYTAIMFLLQFLMTGAGIWAGYKTGAFELRVNMAISLSILFIFGLKTLLTGIRTQAQQKEFDYSDVKVIFLAAIAEGITPLAIGISIGLISQHHYTQWFITGTFLLVGIISALIAVSKTGAKAFKLRFGPIGGLLLLAAAIQMAISLSRF